MLKKRDAAHIQIRPSAVEGECKIKRIFCIEYSPIKGVIFTLSCVVTFGLMWIVSFWLPRYKRKFLYHYSSLQQCSHFLVLNWDSEWSIVRKESLTVQRDETNFIQATGMTNRYLKYYYDVGLAQFSAVEFPFETVLCREFHSFVTTGSFVGLESQCKLEQAFKCYGECDMGIPIPSTWKLTVKSLLHPFFLFQLYSILLWIYEGYYYFVTMIILMSTYSFISDVYLERQNWVNLCKMANLCSSTWEYASYDPAGPVRQVDTKSLVCGTIIYVNENFKLPCDCVLLDGECLVDEAALTGETIPAVKQRIEHQYQDKFVLKKKNMLFEGTTILQISKTGLIPKSKTLPCLVTATNFSTTKGQLLRSILFPKPHKFKFFTESIQFLLILGFITLVGFFILLPGMMQAQARTWNIVLVLMDAITITIPASLPAAMNFGISFALNRLKRSQIFCIQPSKIIVSGRIDTICFDKTGTLTQQGMKIKEISLNQELQVDIAEELLMNCMITCQSLVKVRRELQKQVEMKVRSKQIALAEDIELNTKILGDPMECQMFLHAQGDLLTCDDSQDYRSLVKRTTCNGEERIFGIKKKYDFTSDTQSMSVIVEDPSTNQLYLFTKGAPEVIEKICQNHNRVDYSTYQNLLGLRTIALAYKPLTFQAMFVSREELEQDLIFIGFVDFENQMKPESIPVLEKLKAASIDCKIVTGDNILTAFYVAEACGMFDKQIKFIEDEQGIFRVRTFENAAKVRLNTALSEEIIVQEQTSAEALMHNIDRNHKFLDELLEQCSGDKRSYNLLLTGDVFEVLVNDNPYNNYIKGLTQQVNRQHLNVWRKLLFQCVIFARMKPRQKALLVETLQKLGRTVGMVGDGANDCGALKQADSGLDLSETETSISAHFTSQILNVTSVITLLQNGRAALATNFQCFKFMALYSLIQYVSTIVLSFTFSELSDMQFLYIDLFIICPIFTTMALTEPQEELSVQRPAISLFTVQCMISVFGQVFLQSIAQLSLMMILQEQDFYPGVDDYIEQYKINEEFVVDCVDSTTIFVFNNFLYVASIMAFSVSHPFRKPFYSNLTFTINIILIWTLNVLLTFFSWARLPKLRFYEDTPQDWLVFVVFYAHFWSILFYLWENFICVKMFNQWHVYKRKSQPKDQISQIQMTNLNFK